MAETRTWQQSIEDWCCRALLVVVFAPGIAFLLFSLGKGFDGLKSGFRAAGYDEYHVGAISMAMVFYMVAWFIGALMACVYESEQSDGGGK